MSNYFLTRKQQLTRLLHKYQSEVNSLPEGTLVIYQNGAKWYLQEKDKSGKTKICMIVQDPMVKGGIAAVISGYYGSRLESDYDITYIESYQVCKIGYF